MSIAAMNWKPCEKGAKRGFFDLRYHGMTIKGCRLMDGKNGLWVALPQKEITKEGKRAWVDQLYFAPPEMDHVKWSVLAALRSQGHLPNGDEPAPGEGNLPGSTRTRNTPARTCPTTSNDCA